MARIKANNDPPIPDVRVMSFANRKLSDVWLLNHPDQALGAVHFVRNPTTGIIQYIVQSNSTVRV